MLVCLSCISPISIKRPLIIGPGLAKMCLMPYANNKGADQPAHPRSLISTFVVHCLDSIMPLVSIFEISKLQLFAVAEQTGLSHTWSNISEDTFSRDVAQLWWRKNVYLQGYNNAKLVIWLGKLSVYDRNFNFTTRH